MRIMKDRKHMTHIDLINEAIRQLTGRFNPEPVLIKRRIESLIEVSYLLVSQTLTPSQFTSCRENTWSDAKIASLIITWLVSSVVFEVFG